MKKILLLGAVCSMLSADVKTIPVTPDVIKNYDQIVDIRTPSEWQDTGIIAGAKTITFDPSRKESFFGELSKAVDIKKPIALICRSGRRSAAAAAAIDSADLNIINLDGGMGSLIEQGYKTTPYKK
ncbi:rhodanese-like domain-containing protein [Campylobacter concisus]|uniref:Rhodanese-like domain-containing protein n=1 Tax=Campylobacter concisus TaxID=199 RepID=A0A7S9RNL3_9BACT|nr:rhodanese-like domain-containing protein [Campylobacter concisus]QPH95088.1 rhodanese-like domain-containing protein [Campylobacter concisus]